MTPEVLSWIPRGAREALRLWSDGATTRFLEDIARIRALRDAALVDLARVCLSNVQHVDDERDRADYRLRVVLLPELCERVTPGVRRDVRRITCSAAEHQPGASLFDQLLPRGQREHLDERSQEVRALLQFARGLDARALASWTKFTVLQSKAGTHDPHTYEFSLACAVTPVLAIRAQTSGSPLLHQNTAGEST